jgi:hypothetical protein
MKEFGPLLEETEETAIRSLQMDNFAIFPSLLRDPAGHLPDIRALHAELQIDRGKMQRMLTRVRLSQAYQPSLIDRVYVRVAAGQGLLLLMAIVTNRMLSLYAVAAQNEEEEATLAEEAAELVDGMLEVADDTQRFRPLGASSVPLCLVAAYGIVQDHDKAERLLRHLADFQMDLPNTDWLETAASVRESIRARGAALEARRLGQRAPQVREHGTERGRIDGEAQGAGAAMMTCYTM